MNRFNTGEGMSVQSRCSTALNHRDPDRENRTKRAPPRLANPVPLPLIGTLLAWFDARRTLHALYQRDRRTLRDMGLNPECIYRAYEGAIGDTAFRPSDDHPFDD